MRGRPRKYTKENKPKKTTSIKFGDILDTDAKKKQALTLLMGGRESEFWKFMLAVLDFNISQIEEQILNDDSVSHEKREELRWRRYYMVELRNLPTNLIESIVPEGELPTPSDLDPYE